MGDEIAVRCVGLAKKYGSKEAVRGVGLEVRRGALYGFLGPNGAGKTTTIKMLTGMVRPSGGTAEVAGVDVIRDPLEAKARISLVPDEPRLFDKLTARETLRFVGDVYRMSGREARTRSEELLEMFGLSGAADELVGGYSHGMRQKCALAAALLHEPEVLFLDEPTVGLDPAGARLLKDVLKEMVARRHRVYGDAHPRDRREPLRPRRDHSGRRDARPGDGRRAARPRPCLRRRHSGERLPRSHRLRRGARARRPPRGGLDRWGSPVSCIGCA